LAAKSLIAPRPDNQTLALNDSFARDNFVRRVLVKNIGLGKFVALAVVGLLA
jgi:hypothetical protein